MKYVPENIRKYVKPVVLGLTALVLSNLVAYKFGQLVERAQHYRDESEMVYEIQKRDQVILFLLFNQPIEQLREPPRPSTPTTTSLEGPVL
jgi:hypothetical protein